MGAWLPVIWPIEETFDWLKYESHDDVIDAGVPALLIVGAFAVGYWLPPPTALALPMLG